MFPTSELSSARGAHTHPRKFSRFNNVTVSRNAWWRHNRCLASTATRGAGRPRVEHPQPGAKVVRAENVDGKLPEGIPNGQPDEPEVDLGRAGGRIGGGRRRRRGGGGSGKRGGGGESGRLSVATYCFVYLEGTEWDPGDDVDATDDDIHDVHIRSGVDLRALFIDELILLVLVREDVHIGDGESGQRRSDDQQTGCGEIGLLKVPIDQTDVGLGDVMSAGNAEDRRAAETGRSDPDERYPADATRSGHDALVAVRFSDGDVVIDAEPSKGVDGSDPEDGGHVGLNMAELLPVDPPVEERRPEGEGSDEEPDAEVGHRQRQKEIAVHQSEHVGLEQDEQDEHVGRDDEKSQ